jgi:drug/metabolite transporter (DMT)-like permease
LPAAEKPPTKTALLAGFAAIYLIWGSTYLGIRIAVETIPPFLMAGARFLVAGSILTAWIAFTGGFRATRRQWFDNTIIGGLLLLGGNGLVSWAEQKVPSGIATLIISVSPLFIVLLDWLVLVVGRDATRGSRPTPAIFTGIALGFVGLALLVGPDLSRSTGQLDPWRVGGLVLACFSWGVGSMYTRYARHQAEPFTGAAIQQLTGAVWLLVVSCVLREPAQFEWAAVTGRSLVAWSYLVVAGSLIGFTTFVWLMKHSTPARVSTYAYVNPVVAVFLGWLVLHEPVSPRIFLAAGVIIAGVAIITVARSRKSGPTPPRPAGVVAAGEVVRERT